LERYDIWHYFAYCYYFPLYIAGPIIPFNAFCAQIHEPTKTNNFTIYITLFRAIFWMIALEMYTHIIYINVFDETNLWHYLTAATTAQLSLLKLFYMFLKFTVIWNTFRVTALFDGIYTLENLTRCIVNQQGIGEFWRGWHASFNSWNIRYLYVPLGGRKYQVYSIWFIFIFVGLWHDLWWRWFAWAIYSCCFFSLELMAYKTFNLTSKQGFLSTRAWFIINCILGPLAILFLIISNTAINHGFRDTYKIFYQVFLNWNDSTNLLAIIGVIVEIVTLSVSSGAHKEMMKVVYNKDI